MSVSSVPTFHALILFAPLGSIQVLNPEKTEPFLLAQSSVSWRRALE
jgi:hypothetical protein